MEQAVHIQAKKMKLEYTVCCVFTMFCDLWTKMSAWGISFAAPSTEYWSTHWSSTNSPTLTTMKFYSFSCSCFPLLPHSQISHVSLTDSQTIAKGMFCPETRHRGWCLPRWETATLVHGHWGETVQTSALCQAVPAPGSHLCSAPLLVTSCLPLPSSACSSHYLFSASSKENGYGRTSCKPDVPHWLPGEMC